MFEKVLKTPEQLARFPDGATIDRIRERGAMLLLALYGLRAGEVCNLQMDDIDWNRETIQIRRSKQRKSQAYPLTTEAGNALLRYLEVRPKSQRREVFLTLRQPYRPISVGGFSSLIQKRQKVSFRQACVSSQV